MRRSRSSWLIALAMGLALAGCRPVALETEPGATYAVEVHNPNSYAVEVAFEDGAAARSLGTVTAGGRENFIVVNPADRTVTIVATSPGRPTIRRAVTLQPGGTARVTLTP
jgi:hypothetical protein